MELAKDPNIRWCVKPDCGHPIRRKSRKEKKMECEKCATAICFDCSGLWYNDNLNGTKRTHRCHKHEDKEFVKDFDVQYCPRCYARIQKLEGCNHMKCSYCK